MEGKKGHIILFLLYFLILLFAVYIGLMYIVHGVTNAPLVNGKLKIPQFSLTTWELFFYPHILLGLLSLALGPFQLTNRSRKNPTVHRTLGKVYAGAIFINILLVPYLSLYATGGRTSTVAFLILDAAWLLTTSLGVVRIFQRNFSSHREWMLRSYGITGVFITFRFAVAGITSMFHAPNSISFPLGVYLGIVVNLILIEAYIRKRRKNVDLKIDASI